MSTDHKRATVWKDKVYFKVIQIMLEKPPPDASDYEVTYSAPKKEIDGFVKTYLREGLPIKKETSILDCLRSKEDQGNKSSSNDAHQESSGEGDDTDHGSDIEDYVMKKSELRQLGNCKPEFS